MKSDLFRVCVILQNIYETDQDNDNIKHDLLTTRKNNTNIERKKNAPRRIQHWCI